MKVRPRCRRECNSSCAFFVFSPVMALERRNRNHPTGGVAANVMDVSVRSIFVVFFVSCATSLARMKGCSVSPLFVKIHRVPIGVRPCSFTVSCSQGVYTFISLMHLSTCIASSHSLEGSDAPVNRRSTHVVASAISLQDKAPPLSVRFKRVQTTYSSQCLPQSTYHCQDTGLRNE